MDKGQSSSGGGAGGIILRLRPSSLFTLVFLGLAAIVIAYVAGVMSGRHQTDGPAAKAPAPVAEKAEPVAQEPEGGILPAEELEFARVLRGAPAPRKPSPAMTPAGDAVSGELEAAAAPVQAASPEAETPASESVMFDYVFQMAAFRDENAADGLRQKLEGHGLRTALERSGKLFIVLVRMRGGAERAAELAAVAASLRLGMPLVKSKKPVSP